MSGRRNRTGEVWEHVEVGSLLLVLQDDTRRGLKARERLHGYLALILTCEFWPGREGRLDWMPDSCFASSKWQRVA